MIQYSKTLKKALDNMPIRSLYLKILILNFNEKPIQEIQGISQSGNIQINGSAAIRRTINLTMFANKENNRLEDLNNLIALNKKISIQIGYNSPIPAETGDIVWFNCGTYVIASASSSITTTGATISITAKDKMVLLDGSVGGLFPSSVTFHEYEKIYADNYSEIEHPTIYQIIREAVHIYGEQPYEKIKILDLNNNQLALVKYLGKSRLGFKIDYSAFQEVNDYDANYPITFDYGQDVGYLETSFTFPGELVFSAGESIVSLLDKIVQTLGNYEYFFDLDGNFIFQEKKNYLHNEIISFQDVLDIGYLKEYPEEWYSETFNDTKAIVSLNYSPKYENIKNDFIVWGKKELTSGITSDIRYHLVIEKKPSLVLCKQYLYQTKNGNDIYYSVSDKQNLANEEKGITLIGKPCAEWREELYRQALLRSNINETDGYCDAELLTEWRRLYDTMATYAAEVENDLWDGWNYSLLQDPGNLTYWLDFLDTKSSLSQYSVSAIGRRSKIVKDDKCSQLFKNDTPEVLFAYPPLDLDEKEQIIERNKDKGYSICFGTKDFVDNSLGISTTGITAYEIIKDLLYKHLVYNTSVTINCLPKYYLEPNTLIYIKDTDSNIQGRFVINQITLPLDYKGTMSIQAVQALSQT